MTANLGPDTLAALAVAFQRAIVRADSDRSTRAAAAALQMEVKKLLKKVRCASGWCDVT